MTKCKILWANLGHFIFSMAAYIFLIQLIVYLFNLVQCHKSLSRFQIFYFHCQLFSYRISVRREVRPNSSGNKFSKILIHIVYYCWTLVFIWSCELNLSKCLGTRLSCRVTYKSYIVHWNMVNWEKLSVDICFWPRTLIPTKLYWHRAKWSDMSSFH